MNDEITVRPEDARAPDAVQLLAELSAELVRITGASGQASFSLADVEAPRRVFMVARDAAGTALGCGALRPLSGEIAEVKRMYARAGTRGVGTAVLAALEAAAFQLGYGGVWLETRRVNTRAVQFYLARGYQPIARYGRYQGNSAAICLGKQLHQASRGYAAD